jgi:hypothetical protein
MKHIIITRSYYDDDTKFNDRLKIMEETLIPSLKKQTNQNFTWGLIMGNKNHQKILQSKYDKEIVFFNSYDEYKDYSISNGYSIQTRQDNDDIICENYVKIIQDEVKKTDKDILLIQFQPTKLIYDTKQEYHMFKYSKKFVSMFLSIYQKNVMYSIYEHKHPVMYKLTNNIVTIPEGCANLVVHGNNKLTTLESYDRLIKKPVNPEIKKQTLKITSLIETTRKTVVKNPPL